LNAALNRRLFYKRIIHFRIPVSVAQRVRDS